jgi:hypothetical protein
MMDSDTSITRSDLATMRRRVRRELRMGLTPGMIARTLTQAILTHPDAPPKRIAAMRAVIAELLDIEGAQPSR